MKIIRAEEWERRLSGEMSAVVDDPAFEADSPAMQIVREVCDHHYVRQDQLLGKSRKAHIVAARHDAMKRIRKELCWSLRRIGELFNRDHSAVLYAVQGYANRTRKFLARQRMERQS